MREFGPIYRGLAQLGIKPREADDLEVWEAASILGLADEDERPASTDGVASNPFAPQSPAETARARRDRIEEIKRRSIERGVEVS